MGFVGSADYATAGLLGPERPPEMVRTAERQGWRGNGSISMAAQSSKAPSDAAKTDGIEWQALPLPVQDNGVGALGFARANQALAARRRSCRRSGRYGLSRRSGSTPGTSPFTTRWRTRICRCSSSSSASSLCWPACCCSQCRAAVAQPVLQGGVARGFGQRPLDQWLKPTRAFRLSNAGQIGENPDQRIQQDAQHLAELTTDLGIGLLQSTLLLLSFVGVLWVCRAIWFCRSSAAPIACRGTWCGPRWPMRPSHRF